MVQGGPRWSKQIDFPWTTVSHYAKRGYGEKCRGGPSGPSKMPIPFYFFHFFLFFILFFCIFLNFP